MTAHGDGLRGVVVGESTICDVQPEGNLYYRGYSIHDLARHATFEEVIYLLWHDDLPTRSQLQALRQSIEQHQMLPAKLSELLSGFPVGANSMDALRTGVSALGMFDPDAGDNSEEANQRKALRVQSLIPAIAAANERISQGKLPIAPKPGLGIAANFLYMLEGHEPDPLFARTLDIDLILHADHELNASTFATRVTVSVQADLYSGMVSGIGTLSGPKHGGAAEETMQMLLEVGSPERVDDYVRPRLAGEKRSPIPGFGHAVYRAPDPRATHLRDMSRQLGELNRDLRWYEITTATERIVDELSNTAEYAVLNRRQACRKVALLYCFE